jgi:hypothetical protein
MNSPWPLHPVPHKYETLIRWIERTAAAYGVSMPVFCRHALGIERQDMWRLHTTDLPVDALLRIAAGTGIPVEQLQTMNSAMIWAQLLTDLEEFAKNNPGAVESFLNVRRNPVP